MLFSEMLENLKKNLKLDSNNLKNNGKILDINLLEQSNPPKKKISAHREKK